MQKWVNVGSNWLYTRNGQRDMQASPLFQGYLCSHYLVGDLFQTVQVPMIVEKLVESRWKGIDTFQMIIWPAYSFTGYSFIDTIVWKYLVTLRNALIVLSRGGFRFNLVLHRIKKKKKKKKIFKFQNILNNILIGFYDSFYQNIKDILRYNKNSSSLNSLIWTPAQHTYLSRISTLKLNYRNEKLLTLRFASSRWKIQR